MPLDRLSDLLSSDDARTDGAIVLYECRHCGTKFEDPPKRCSVCDTTEIAEYEFEIEEGQDEHDDHAGAEGRDCDGGPNEHDAEAEPGGHGGEAGEDEIEATRAGQDDLEDGTETDDH